MRVIDGVVWQASALSAGSRLWLGGVVQVRRERNLIGTLLEGVRACGTFETLVLCTDGLSSCPKQTLKVLREPIRNGKRKRLRLLFLEGLMVAQAIKRYARRRVIRVVRRVVRGTKEAVQARLISKHGSESAVINTAYIERLQATLRSRLASLARKTRAARRRSTLEAGMWLIGTVCTDLHLLYAPPSETAGGWRCRAAMDRMNSGPGRGPHRLSLVALRALELCRSSDSAQATWAKPEVVVGDRSCCLTIDG